MRHRDAELRRRQRPGKRGVGVAVHDHRVRRRIQEERLQGDQHPARLVAVAAATDSEAVVGPPRQAELGEEVAAMASS